MRAVQTLMLGSLATNCYIVYTGEKQVIAADIGGDAGKLLRFIEERGLTLTKILLTHGHWDHIGAVAEVQRATGADVYIHELDAVMLTDAQKSLAAWIDPFCDCQAVTDYHTVKDGDVIEDGDAEFTVMHTPRAAYAISARTLSLQEIPCSVCPEGERTFQAEVMRKCFLLSASSVIFPATTEYFPDIMNPLPLNLKEKIILLCEDLYE